MKAVLGFLYKIVFLFTLVSGSVAMGLPAFAMISEERYATLARGIVMNHWLNGQQKLIILDEDLAQLKKAGFTFVRLPIDAAATFYDLEHKPTAYTLRLDRVLEALFKHKLAVSLVMTYSADTNAQALMAKYPGFAELLAQKWHYLAERYAKTNPNHVFFELLHEPQAVFTVAAWNILQERLVRAIRHATPNHTIIATVAPESKSSALPNVTLLKDENVIYGVQFYDFPAFTFQGTKRIASMARNVSFPNPDRGMTMATIERSIRNAALWARDHRVHIIATEFGVSRKAPAPSITFYLKEVRTLLERYKIGWAVWDYAGPEAALFKGDAAVRRPINEADMHALGLSLR